MLIKIKQFFNKYIRGRLKKPVGERKNSRTGQVAIVLMIVIAMGLIFYAAVLNFGRISETKVYTTIGSNVGAARLASQMASYGQNLIMTYLGGELEKCAWSGLFVIVLVVALFCWACAATMVLTSGMMLMLRDAGLMGSLGLLLMFLSPANLLLMGVVFLQLDIELGLSRKWNAQKASLSLVDDFVQTALGMGLHQAVTDTVNVPDLNDSDNDSVWGWGQDEINRYSFYYDNYVSMIDGSAAAYLANFPAVRNFVEGLKELLYQGADNWGITDPWKMACPSHACCYDPDNPTVIPSVCNPCCVPDVVIDPFSIKPTSTQRLRPACCDIGGPGQCGVSTTCDAATVYAGLPYVYDSTYQNYDNTFDSYLEKLGFDDEHEYFYRTSGVMSDPQTPELPGQQGFQMDDATGYSVERGVYPYLYRLGWGIDLTVLNNPTEPEDCYWFDPRYEDECNGVSMPPPLSGLTLPIPPYSLTFNVKPRVDSVNQNIAGNPPVAVDKVILPANIVAAPTACAQNLSATTGFWKSGADRFCRTDWPYYGPCAKNLPGTCSTADETCLCGEGATDPRKFPEDVLDAIVYGLKEFVDIGETVIREYEANPAGVSAGLSVWYPQIGQWVSSSGALGNWANELGTMSQRLRNFINGSYAGSCSEVWCGTSSACPGMRPLEAATVGGSLTNIIRCLNYNIEGENASGSAVNPVGTNRGNDYRFDLCGDTCSAVNCRRLPRSLVPGFNPAAYVPGPLANEAQIAVMLTCLDGCNVANCSILPLTRASGGAYTWSQGDPAAFVLENCTLWGEGNPWYEDIVVNIRSAGPSCDLTNPTGWLYNVRRSAREAANQVAKFRHRRQYLQDRIADANQLIQAFDEGAARFRSFVNGPAAALASAANRGAPAFVPYHLIYGWQGEPRPGSAPGTVGLWHIVKVEARTPKRCDNRCGAGAPGSAPPNSADPEFPQVRTRLTAWGLRRCYYYDGAPGVVKFRATRFDEIRPNFTTLLFPNGLPLWNFRAFYPGIRTADATNLEVTCASQFIPDPPVPALPGGVSNVYRGAFMMWERTPDNATCWNRVHQILTAGVVTETCARYDWMGNGMGFAFIPCSPF